MPDLPDWYGCLQEQDGSKPPAPDAPEARQWKPQQPSLSEAPGDVPAQDRNLPLQIVIDDIPEIPEEIQGPSPPIEAESEAEDPSSTRKR